jgi:hypothetical protein
MGSIFPRLGSANFVAFVDPSGGSADQDPAFSTRIRQGLVIPLRFDEAGGPRLRG